MRNSIVNKWTIVACSLPLYSGPLLCMNSAPKTVDIPTLFSLALKKVPPYELYGLIKKDTKNKPELNINLGNYQAISSWPEEYIKEHSDTMVAILEEANSKHETEEEDKQYFELGKLCKDRILSLKNHDLSGKILAQFHVLENKKEKNELYQLGSPLAPMMIFLHDLPTDKIRQAYIEHCAMIESLDHIYDIAHFFVPSLYSRNPYLSRTFDPKTVCKFLKSSCCKSISLVNDIRLLNIIKYYHDYHLKEPLLAADFLKKYAQYAQCRSISEIATIDKAKYYLTLENEVETKIKETIKDVKGVASSTIKAVGRIITINFLDIIFHESSAQPYLNLVEQLFKQIVNDPENLNPKQVGNFWINTPLKGNDKTDLDIAQFFWNQCADATVLKQITACVIRGMFKTFHMDRQELHQFIRDIYAHRSTYCTRPTEEKKQELFLLNQIHQIIDLVLK